MCDGLGNDGMVNVVPLLCDELIDQLLQPK